MRAVGRVCQTGLEEGGMRRCGWCGKVEGSQHRPSCGFQGMVTNLSIEATAAGGCLYSRPNAWEQLCDALEEAATFMENCFPGNSSRDLTAKSLVAEYRALLAKARREA